MLLILVAVMIVIVDQASKHLVVSHIAYGETLSLVPNILSLTHVRNFGAAFGLFYRQRVLFFGAMLILVVAVVVFWKEIVRGGRFAVWATACVLGGAFGNFLDRIRLGYVVDFVDVGFWPVFNVADSAIVVGMAVLSYVILRAELRWARR
ncbi:MAG: Lipoprotein signal peptidase [Firmicutes bacterium]|nr:Lipoprotein signal peptidase [candidate division NPL-UPA2 bacterium]